MPASMAGVDVRIEVVKFSRLNACAAVEGSVAYSAAAHRLPTLPRHTYAHTLLSDKCAPLSAARALLRHASMQTTAADVKTDRTKLRKFIEHGIAEHRAVACAS
jgi:site-specific recombinase XerD